MGLILSFLWLLVFILISLSYVSIPRFELLFDMIFVWGELMVLNSGYTGFGEFMFGNIFLRLLFNWLLTFNFCNDAFELELLIFDLFSFPSGVTNIFLILGELDWSSPLSFVWKVDFEKTPLCNLLEVSCSEVNDSIFLFELFGLFLSGTLGLMKALLFFPFFNSSSSSL